MRKCYYFVITSLLLLDAYFSGFITSPEFSSLYLTLHVSSLIGVNGNQRLIQKLSCTGLVLLPYQGM